MFVRPYNISSSTTLNVVCHELRTYYVLFRRKKKKKNSSLEGSCKRQEPSEPDYQSTALTLDHSALCQAKLFGLFLVVTRSEHGGP